MVLIVVLYVKRDARVSSDRRSMTEDNVCVRCNKVNILYEMSLMCTADVCKSLASLRNSDPWQTFRGFYNVI